MSADKIKWTKAELKEFDKLTWDVSSPNQLVRLKARMTDMPAFIEKHGQAKCDAMWAHLQEKDAKS